MKSNNFSFSFLPARLVCFAAGEGKNCPGVRVPDVFSGAYTEFMRPQLSKLPDNRRLKRARLDFLEAIGFKSELAERRKVFHARVVRCLKQAGVETLPEQTSLLLEEEEKGAAFLSNSKRSGFMNDLVGLQPLGKGLMEKAIEQEKHFAVGEREVKEALRWIGQNFGVYEGLSQAMPEVLKQVVMTAPKWIGLYVFTKYGDKFGEADRDDIVREASFSEMFSEWRKKEVFDVRALITGDQDEDRPVVTAGKEVVPNKEFQQFYKELNGALRFNKNSLVSEHVSLLIGAMNILDDAVKVGEKGLKRIERLVGRVFNIADDMAIVSALGPERGRDWLGDRKAFLRAAAKKEFEIDGKIETDLEKILFTNAGRGIIGDYARMFSGGSQGLNSEVAKILQNLDFELAICIVFPSKYVGYSRTDFTKGGVDDVSVGLKDVFDGEKCRMLLRRYWEFRDENGILIPGTLHKGIYI